jgi:hypothetical protein
VGGTKVKTIGARARVLAPPSPPEREEKRKLRMKRSPNAHSGGSDLEGKYRLVLKCGYESRKRTAVGKASLSKRWSETQRRR